MASAKQDPAEDWPCEVLELTETSSVDITSWTAAAQSAYANTATPARQQGQHKPQLHLKDVQAGLGRLLFLGSPVSGLGASQQIQ